MAGRVNFRCNSAPADAAVERLLKLVDEHHERASREELEELVAMIKTPDEELGRKLMDVKIEGGCATAIPSPYLEKLLRRWEGIAAAVDASAGEE